MFKTFAAIGASALLLMPLSAQTSVNFGANGIQTISYNGVILEDTTKYSGDAFHAYHVTATDLKGNSMSSGDYGWGENCAGKSWSLSTQTETYTCSWGGFSVQYAASSGKLNSTVTLTNKTGSGVIIGGVNIYPYALHFPKDPVNFNGYSQFAPTTTGPGIVVADYGTGVATVVTPTAKPDVYTGWGQLGNSTYFPLMTTTAPSDLASYLPQNNSNLMPGNSLTYTVSVRFTNEGTAANISDATSNYTQVYPSQFSWTDRRIIGSAYLASNASSGNGNANIPSGCGATSANPRNYKVSGTIPCTYNVNSTGFQDNILNQALSIVANAKILNAQGVITWDIEGEEYPQTTSYVCSPDLIATLSPEMEQTVSSSNFSAYNGMKLDDAYFKIITNAGIRAGVCLRPNILSISNGVATQGYATSDAQIISTIESKAKFANSRWNATIFYVDSSVYSNGGVLNPSIWQQVSTDLPTFMFSPEVQKGQVNIRNYAYTAQLFNFINNQDLGTSYDSTFPVWQVYPEAFGLNIVNDVNPSLLNNSTTQLIKGVENGDILITHADFAQANNPAIVAIYKSAFDKTLFTVQSLFTK